MTIKVFSHNPLIAGIITILFGSALIYFKNDFINTLLLISGVILLIMSVIRFIVFLKSTSGVENRWSYLPFSVVFMATMGSLFIASPSFWVSFSEIAIAILILVLVLSKIMFLTQLRMNGVKISLLYYVMPLILLAASILAIKDPKYVLGSITVAFGVVIVLFGISEIIDYIIIRNDRLRKEFGSISISQEPDVDLTKIQEAEVVETEVVETEEVKDEEAKNN